MGNIAVILRSFNLHSITPNFLLQLYASLFPPHFEPAVSSHEDGCKEEAPAERSPAITDDDVKEVMERLGLPWEAGGGGGEGLCVEYMSSMREETQASETELEQAFAVFDEDGDGYVTAEELRGVMRRLRFRDGARVEDCRRMIEAFDEDGDGRIDLREFRKLLEGAE